MPGKKGKKGKKKGKKGSKKGDKSEESKGGLRIIADDPMPKQDYLSSVLGPGEKLINLLTTHEVKEKEVHNISVGIKTLTELTPQEIRDLREVFNVFDGNSDGLLNWYEFRQAFKCLGFRMTKDFAKEMAEEAGINRKAPPSIDFNDFMEFVIERQGDHHDHHDEIVQGFKYFDVDQKGKITIDNLTKLCKDHKIHITTDDLRDMIEEADVNGDDAVDQAEFIRIMLQTNLF